MSAPAANPAAVTAGQTPAAGAWALAKGAQAKGAPVAGFEALLATLFPTVEPGAAAGLAKGGLGLFNSAATTATQPAADKSDQDAVSDASAVQAQLAALLAIQPAPVQAAVTAAASGETAKPAPATAAVLVVPTQPAAQPPGSAAGILPETATANASAAAAALPVPAPAAPTAARLPAQPQVQAQAQAQSRTQTPASAASVPVQPLVQPAAEPKAPPALVLAALPPTGGPAQPTPEVQAETPAPATAALAASAETKPTPKAEKPDMPAAARAGTPPASAATPAPATLAEIAAAAQPAQGAGDGGHGQPPPDQRETASTDQGAPDIAAAPTAGPATAAHMIQAEAAAVAARGSPETVAKLAAQIVKKLDGKSSRFDIALDPAGLGKVDVKVEINAQGQMTAALNFDNAAAAGDLRNRAGELRAALEQAGFDMSNANLSFSYSGQGDGSGQAFGQRDGQGGGARVLQALADDQPVAAPVSTSSLLGDRTSGVDVRI